MHKRTRKSTVTTQEPPSQDALTGIALLRVALEAQRRPDVPLDSVASDVLRRMRLTKESMNGTLRLLNRALRRG